MSEAANPGREAAPQVTVAEIFRAFFLIGLTSFGGGIVAYLRDSLVEKHKWVTDYEFLAALEIGQTLPGLNGVNVAVIVGRRLRGAHGAIAAAVGILIPGAVIVTLLGYLYMRFRNDPQVGAVLAGVSAAAVGLLLQVTLKIGRKQLVGIKNLGFVVLVFILVGVFHVSLLVTLVCIAPIAIYINRPKSGLQKSDNPGALPPTV